LVIGDWGLGVGDWGLVIGWSIVEWQNLSTYCSIKAVFN